MLRGLFDLFAVVLVILFVHRLLRPNNIRGRLRQYRLRHPQVIRMGSKSELWLGNGKVMDEHGNEVQTIPFKDVVYKQGPI